jgi:hypothetical protein
VLVAGHHVIGVARGIDGTDPPRRGCRRPPPPGGDQHRFILLQGIDVPDTACQATPVHLVRMTCEYLLSATTGKRGSIVFGMDSPVGS